jgi:heme/copper-type cytochrome/quinol oxidase subunit 1
MHGTTMVFMVGMPWRSRCSTTSCRCRSVRATSRSAAQRLSYWMFLFAAHFMNASCFIAQRAERRLVRLRQPDAKQYSPE